MTEDLLPPPLRADLADFDRGAFNEDFDGCMEFLADMIRSGQMPWRIERVVNAAVAAGYLSPAGDVLVRNVGADDEGYWNIEMLGD